MPEPGALDAFLALPRLHNLHVSPDGSRLAMTVLTVAADGKRFEGAVWEVDLVSGNPPRRITVEGNDETARGFTSRGDLLITRPESRRETSTAERAGNGGPTCR